MSGLSRRDFFRRFSHDLSDQVDFSAVKKIFAATRSDEEGKTEKKDEWIVVARSTEVVPGAVVEIRQGAVSIVLKSNAEGVWAVNEDGACVALRSGGGGTILANIGIVWPTCRGLSHATGESIDLNHSEGDCK